MSAPLAVAGPSGTPGGNGPARAWADYLAAAQRLDAARRDAATLVSERQAVAAAANKELAGARQRLAAQRSRLLDLATRLGVPAPRVTVDATELAEAQATLAATGAPNPAAAATAVLRANRAAIDGVDVALSTLDDPRSPARPTGTGRNLLTYAIVALVATVLPVLLILFGPNDPSQGARFYLLNAGAYCGAVIFPLIGYGIAWAIVGGLADRPAGGRPNRNAALGALITAACVILVYGCYLAYLVAS